MFNSPTRQSQVLELARGNLAALEGLWQHPSIVGDQYRKFRNQGTVAQFGLRHFDFSGQPQPAPLVDGAVITVRGNHRAADVSSLASVQGNAQQPQGINTKTNGAIGISRLEVQHETLRPLLGFRRGSGAITVVVIEVEIPHSQGSFAIT
ncbi:hypothetical protein D3C72_1321030 [compost metagenome]